MLTQIPGGWLAARYGGRWIFGLGIVMTAILTLLTPVAAYTNAWLILVVRFLEGLFEVSWDTALNIRAGIPVNFLYLFS